MIQRASTTETIGSFMLTDEGRASFVVQEASAYERLLE
jgi:hypothetical protein